MYAPQPKKLLILNILDILRRYSDENHRLSQKDIVDRLATEYEMKAGRKAVKRNLLNLIDFGFELEYKEIDRKNTRGEEETIYTDWYLTRSFSDAELRLLIDSLLFMKHMPNRQCKEMIEKLKKESSIYFSAKVKHICNMPSDSGIDRQLFYTIDILDEAIERHCKVKFNYAVYDADKYRHIKTDRGGQPIEYIVNPYQMAATNGFYYLIGNIDTHNDIAHFRIDRIADIKLLYTVVKPQQNVQGLEDGIQLSRHMAEHIYMFGGESVRVIFKADRRHLDEVFDWFGTDVTITDITDSTVNVSLTVNRNAMKYWAIQYGQFVEILEPADLRDDVTKTLRKILSKYTKKPQ